MREKERERDLEVVGKLRERERDLEVVGKFSERKKEKDLEVVGKLRERERERVLLLLLECLCTLALNLPPLAELVFPLEKQQSR